MQSLFLFTEFQLEMKGFVFPVQEVQEQEKGKISGSEEEGETPLELAVRY